MRFAIDVAFLDRRIWWSWHGAPGPLADGSRPRRRGRNVLEAPAGSFERWGLRVGDRLEIAGRTG